MNYPSLFLGELPQEISGNVRLEVGSARVTPHVARDITSWVHEKLVATDTITEFDDNRARGVRCVHPLVTLLEKLDALHRRFPNEKVLPQMFVRHYEDAARLIEGVSKLPPLDGYASVRALADEMLAQKQLAAMPVATDVALASGDDTRWSAVCSAHTAIHQGRWLGSVVRGYLAYYALPALLALTLLVLRAPAPICCEIRLRSRRLGPASERNPG